MLRFVVILSFATFLSDKVGHFVNAGNKKPEGSLQSHAYTDEEYKFNMGHGYVFFEILDPPELSYTFKVNPAFFSPPWNSSFVSIGLVPSDPECGCGTFFNKEDVEGNVALIERGECSFMSKVLKAQEAGAVGAIVADVNESNDDLYITMQHDTTERKVDIPAAYLLGKNGQIIKRTLSRLGMTEATMRIPINITTIPIHKLKQPPWIVW